MSLLSVRGLTRDFDGLRAVDGVDLDIPAGEVRALIGPNGAGKTTLLKMLTGEEAPDTGTVTRARSISTCCTGRPKHLARCAAKPSP